MDLNFVWQLDFHVNSLALPPTFLRLRDTPTKMFALLGLSWVDGQDLAGPRITAMAVLCTIILSIVGLLFAFEIPLRTNSWNDVPLINPAASFDLFKLSAKKKFAKSSQDLMSLGRRLYPRSPFRILTDWGEVMILPGDFAHEIRNNPNLSFALAAKQDNHANIPGFETVELIAHESSLIQNVARKYLTQHLSMVIRPLSDETRFALEINFGLSTDWRTVHLKKTILDIIARISSRIYLGDQLCRNEAWLQTTKDYTTAFFIASSELRAYPRLIRPWAHWTIPSCHTLRVNLKKARSLIGKLNSDRKACKQAALEANAQLPKFHDALAWAEQEAASKGAEYDPATFQLTLALLAIHTTYDLMEQCVIDLAKHPQFLEPLREEIFAVLSKGGWKKSSLYELKLLDSAIKESQRLKPGSLASMRRYVTADTHLSNGITLQKGDRINVDGNRMMDADLHPNPLQYDAFRFHRMRSEPGREFMAQLAATSAEHIGFGHGQHSCPGRFFASNEIKVALCHMIIKYEWKLAPNTTTTPDVKGMVVKASSATNIMVQRRPSPEIDLDAL